MKDDVHEKTDDTGGDGDKPDGAINGVFHGTTQQNWWGDRASERGAGDVGGQNNPSGRTNGCFGRSAIGEGSRPQTLRQTGSQYTTSSD
jgi:hypothetical protein